MQWHVENFRRSLSSSGTMFQLLSSSLAFLLIARALSLQECSDDHDKKIERCLEPMISFAGGLTTTSMFPFDGKHMLNKLCQLYEGFRACISDWNCHSPSVEAIEASYGYMCGEAYNEFLNYVDCFMKVELNGEYQKCKDVASNSIGRVQNKPFGSENYFDELCTIMQSYLHCSKEALLFLCDERAWQLVGKVTKESLKITIPDCDMSFV